MTGTTGPQVVGAMDRTCTKDVLLKIAQLGFDWKLLGRRLIGEQGVRDIKRDEDDEQNRREKLLLTWLQQKGSKSTYSRLVEVLREIKDNETADNLISLVRGKDGGKWEVEYFCI